MSKAILVMDMPESCSKCGSHNPYGYKEWTCVLTGNIIGELRESRHEGCPLKPLPDRKPESRNTVWESGYSIGWNDCLEKIGGIEDD